MSNLKLFSLTLIFLLFVIACKKETTKQITTSPSKLKTFFSDYRNQAQSLTLNSTTGGSLIGAKGIKLYFQPNSFVTKTGVSVTGNITITLKEVYSKGDMILNNLAPTSNGKPLISGGEFFIGAAQNGNELRLASGKNIFVEMPLQRPDPEMGFFKGKVAADSSINWIEDTITTVDIVNDTIAGGHSQNYYVYSLDSLGWSNFDRFYFASNLTSFYVVTPETFVDTNTAVFVVFTNEHSAARLSYYNAANHTFEVDHSNTIPIGMQIDVVAISEQNGQMYWSKTTTTITANQHLSISFTPKTRAEIEQLVAAL